MDAADTDTETDAGTIALRWLIRKDLDRVLAIERASYRRDFTWGREDFIQTLNLGHVIGTVAELYRPAREPVVAGFILYAHLYEPGTRLPGEPRHLEILNIAVDPLYRGRDLGRKLVARVTHKPGRHVHAQADVHEANLGALLFFRALGWRATGLLRNQYDWPDGADAVRMEYHRGRRP